MDAERFRIDVPQTVLDDLQQRLEMTRWPDQVAGAGWDNGVVLSYLKELIDYWRHEFDWRAQERAMNRFDHYRTEVDGLGIHFILERAKGPDSLPLIVTHGWPGSFFEMHKIIRPLADPGAYGGDPADSFDVVVPSLPGYGFSERPASPGMARRRVADLWAKLMVERLGYARFAAHGGDIGATVTDRLGLHHPDKLIGIHVTAVMDAWLGPGSAELSRAERAYLEYRREWEREEDAYGHIQRTRPQTAACALNDSPAGLAAWIVEKFRSWSDCGGDVESRFSKDELLANITIYWVTSTINSSFRLYSEQYRNPDPLQRGQRVQVPSGVCLTREQVDLAPREWAERSYNLQHWNVLPSGGHFAALEEPELLVDDIRRFFRNLR